MQPLTLLACPACTLGNPRFHIVSLFVGTVPLAYFLLRPYTKSIRAWGLPKINVPRILSLCLMLLCLVPFLFVERKEHQRQYVESYLTGMVLCCVYLWFRACWLLDARGVKPGAREVLFPGVLIPAIMLLGTLIGNSILFPLTIFLYTFLAIPLWFVVRKSLQHTLGECPVPPD